MLLNQQYGVDASIILGMICDLGVLSPDNFPAGRDQAQFADVHFDDGALGEDAELAVHWALRVLLDGDDGQLEGGLQFRVGHVYFLHAEGGGADETLHLRGVAGESLAHKRGFRYHALPALLLSLTGLHYFENFVLGQAFDLRQGDTPLARLFFALLLHHVRQDFAAIRLGPVHQIGRKGGSVTGNRTGALAAVLRHLLVVHPQFLLHFNLFDVATTVENLRFEAAGFLRFLAQQTGRTGFLLSLTLGMVHAASLALNRLFDVLVLRLNSQNSQKEGEREREDG